MPLKYKNIYAPSECPVNGFSNFFMKNDAFALKGYEKVNSKYVQGYDVAALLKPDTTNTHDGFCVPVYVIAVRDICEFWYGEEDHHFYKGEEIPVAYLPQNSSVAWKDLSEDEFKLDFLDVRRLVDHEVPAVLHFREFQVPFHEPLEQKWVSFDSKLLTKPKNSKNLDHRRKKRIVV